MKCGSNDKIGMAGSAGTESPHSQGLSRAGYTAASFGCCVFHAVRKMSIWLFWFLIAMMVFDAVLRLLAPEQLPDFTLSSALGAVLVLAALFLFGMAASALEEKMRRVCSRLRLPA